MTGSDLGCHHCGHFTPKEREAHQMVLKNKFSFKRSQAIIYLGKLLLQKESNRQLSAKSQPHSTSQQKVLVFACFSLLSFPFRRIHEAIKMICGLFLFLLQRISVVFKSEQKQVLYLPQLYSSQLFFSPHLRTLQRHTSGVLVLLSLVSIINRSNG